MSNCASGSSKEEMDQNQNVLDLVQEIKGMTYSEEACVKLFQEGTVRLLVDLAMSRDASVASTSKLSSDAFDILINISSFERSCELLCTLGTYGKNKGHAVFWLLLKGMLSSKDKLWCLRCFDVLTNLTRSTFSTSFLNDTHQIELLNQLMKVSVRLVQSCIEHGQAMALLANLAQDVEVGRFLLNKSCFWHRVFDMYISRDECQYWKEFVAFTVKNIARSTTVFHQEIIFNDHLFSIILSCLMTDELCEVLNQLPSILRACRFPLRLSKCRFPSLETLFLLCATGRCRSHLRIINVYEILKNFASTNMEDEESDVTLDIINLLIRTEEEIVATNLAELDIPSEIAAKFIADDLESGRPSSPVWNQPLYVEPSPMQLALSNRRAHGLPISHNPAEDSGSSSSRAIHKKSRSRRKGSRTNSESE